MVGWVQVSLENKLENLPKIVIILIFCGSIPSICVLFAHTLLKVVNHSLVIIVFLMLCPCQ